MGFVGFTMLLIWSIFNFLLFVLVFSLISLGLLAAVSAVSSLIAVPVRHLWPNVMFSDYERYRSLKLSQVLLINRLNWNMHEFGNISAGSAGVAW